TPSVLPQAHAAADDHDHGHGDGHGHGPDEGQKTAGQLRPTAEQVPFYRPVVTAAAGLFGLALVFGVAYRSFGGKDPGVAASEADQAAAHHDHHDHHDGHADHHHGGHGGHGHH